MSRDDLNRLREWFSAYAAGFLEDEPEHRRNVVLKIRHTGLVAENILSIAKSEGLNGHDLEIAAAAGILHDTGRFPQYQKFRTFKDSESVNHGVLGAEIIEREGVLGWLAPEDRKLVLDAVKFHNANKVPELGDARAETFIRLVRDADKLDIWRVFLDEYLEIQPWERASAAGLSLPDAPHATPEVVSTLLGGHQVTLSMVRNSRDIILMIVGWCRDINFPSTWRMLVERGYLDRYIGHIEGDPDAVRAVIKTREALERRFA